MPSPAVSVSSCCGFLCGRGSPIFVVVRTSVCTARQTTTTTTTTTTASSVRYKKLQAAASGWLLAATLALSGFDPEETLSNVPQTLSGGCEAEAPKDCRKPRIQHPKSRRAESCTIKCVTTCIRGGDGAPGEGPLNVRRPLVVFKQGFRSRQYCLVECSDICNLIGDGEDGP